MRLGKLVLFFVLAFSLTSHATEDNVLIDLSVLDGLGVWYTAPSKPLFPTLPKKNKLVNKAKIAKKKKTTDVAKTIIKPIKEEKIVVVDVEPIESSIDSDEKINALNIVEDKTVEEVRVVDVEPSDTDNVVLNEEENELIESNEIFQNKVISSESSKPELLIKAEEVDGTASISNNVIVFEDGLYELSQEQISKVDNIVKSFKDPNINKIAIYSHNLDDGIDTFKKKRTSLNRAVEIRSYLIKQGYKNFSIKVINVNTASDKINTVELEEI